MKAAIAADPLESADPWVKAGLMIRDSLQPGSIYYDAILRTDLQAAVQWRPDTDGACQGSGMLTLEFQDGRLEIERAGATVSKARPMPTITPDVMVDFMERLCVFIALVPTINYLGDMARI